MARAAVIVAKLASSSSSSSSGAAGAKKTRGVGVDVEDLDEWEDRVGDCARGEHSTFVERNFTPEEIAYCSGRTAPAASFAGRWCAKEAVVKALCAIDPEDQGVASGDAATPLLDIEVLAGASGAPVVVLHGQARAAADRLGVGSVSISISHSESVAMAVAHVYGSDTKTS